MNNTRPRKGKMIRRAVVFLLLCALVFFAGRYFIYVKIKSSIETELANLGQQGIFVTYDNLDVDTWEGGIEVYNLTVKVRKDSLAKDGSDHGLEARLPFVEVKGVGLIPFIRDKTLAIRTIYSHETNVTYSLKSTLFKHVGKNKRKVELKHISVNDIDLPDIDVYLTDLVSSDTIAHILTDLNMDDLVLSKQLDSLTWQKGNVDITNFAMNYRKEYYGLSVKKVHLDIFEKTIDIDSLLLKPVVGRTAFMKVKARQTNYMEAFIPKLKLHKINWYTYPAITLQIDRVDLSLKAKMFRDKRLPFVPEKVRSLPSHYVHRLPLKLQIDTVNIKNSYVNYEEMPAEGDSTGLVYFDNLNSTILNIHNDRRLKVETTMHATSKFMGAGKLDVYFTFPYDTLKQYRVVGTLRDMPLPRINKMLGASARAKVESGIMRNLKFDFRYNNEKAGGNVELNYQDLKVLTLREDKNNKQTVSFVKTLLLNAFLIRKNMDEGVKEDKRQGEIDFHRDVHKSVFNYWWKSILSGIKSAYNLDKLPLKASRSEKAANKKEKKKKRKSLKETWSRIFD